MIAKNIKGKSFKGCVNYVMNDTAQLLEAEGVLATSKQDMIRSFAMQRSGRKEIKQPVGHIPISFAPEDKARMNDEFMVQLAKEYMQEMEIKNTQYIIVRHYNTDNDHLHIVYNRINNDLKLISVNNDYKRNIKICKKLKDKYNLTYGKGKDRVKREKLNNPDKVKYYMYDAIKAVLPTCKTPADLRFGLQKFGIELDYKHKRTTREIEGVSFRYDNICFKGSEIDRKFSFWNLKKAFEKNIETAKKQVPKQSKLPSIGGVELTSEQWHILQEGGHIYLENMINKDTNVRFSSYVFLNDEKTAALFCKGNPNDFVKYGKYEMRIRDKMLIENGNVTQAKVKWYGIGNFAYPYLWKENKSDSGYQESWGDPRKLKVQKFEEGINKKNILNNLKKRKERGI